MVSASAEPRPKSPRWALTKALVLSCAVALGLADVGMRMRHDRADRTTPRSTTQRRADPPRRGGRCAMRRSSANSRWLSRTVCSDSGLATVARNGY